MSADPSSSDGTHAAVPSSSRQSLRVADERGRVLGFVEIDRIVAGRCCGGIRITPDVSAEELKRIAEVMTLKCAFAGLAAGGAKGGVVMPPDTTAEARAERLNAYGRALAPLLRSGAWSHGTDMGATDDDLARIRHGAGLGPDPGPPRSISLASPGDGLSGRAAGLTVALSAEAALECLDIPLKGATFAVQGAGAVGRAALEAMTAAGASLVGLSTREGTLRDPAGLDPRRILEGLKSHGDAFTSHGEASLAVISTHCDVLLVCAGTASLDLPAAERLSARVVVCGANIPFGAGVEARLSERGIMVIPDFVAGAGGVLGTTLAAAGGLAASEVERLLRRHFKPLVAATIRSSLAAGLTVADEARQRAFRGIAACEAAYGPEKPPTLLPERLAPPPSAVIRLVLALERRSRRSPRLARLFPWLHAQAVARTDRIMGAALAAGPLRSAREQR